MHLEIDRMNGKTEFKMLRIKKEGWHVNERTQDRDRAAQRDVRSQ